MKYPKLPKRFKAKWVAALRSGKYKQGTGALRDSGEYCCLGVACAITKCRIAEAEDGFIPATKKVIPAMLTGESSLTRFLANHNDGTNDKEKWDFPQVATWIEKHL